MRELDRTEPQASVAGEPRPRPASAHDERHAKLTRYYLPREHVLWPGNRCQLLHDGVEAFPAMLAAIEGARRYVRLCMYMFLDDAVGQLFARALSEAAGRGVEVTVFYDAFGSLGTPRAFFRRMRQAGVDVRPFRPFSWRFLRSLVQRDHRKLLIADGEVGFIGGMNLGAKWAPRGGEIGGEGWRDDVLRVDGPAVRQLERAFGASWRLHLNLRLQRLRALLEVRRVWPSRARGDVSLAVLSSRRSIYRSYLHAIARARHTVLIAAAYFVPDGSLVRALTEASRRGVRVELILNSRCDHPLLTWVTRAFYQRLLDSGVVIHEWCSGVLHSKTAVVDGVWGTVGSFNLERISIHVNHEVNVAFADPRLGRILEESFERDRARCTRLDPERWRRRPRWQKALEAFLHLFRKLA